MAESNIPVTPGSGNNVDFFTLTSPANQRQAVVIGDKSTNAAVAPVDATKGLAVDLTATGSNTNKLLVTPDSVALPNHQSTNVDQLNGTTIDTNSGSKSAGTQRVVLATDQPSMTNPQPANITQVAGSTIAQGHGTAASAIRVELPTDGTGQVTANNPADTAPATQNITAADVATTSTSQQNSQAAITGAPTANSFATFAVSTLDAVSVQITGTWSATLVIEFSVDGGTTYFTKGLHLNGTNYTVASVTANATGTMNVATATHVRIRCTAYTSGTATVRLVGSVNPNSFYLVNNPKIADGTTPSQTLAVDNSGALSANITKIGGTALALGQTTKSASLPVTLASDQGALVAVGGTASGSSLTASPLTVGGLAKTALPTAVSDGQVVNAMGDKFGRQVVIPGTFRDLVGTQTTTISASTSETTIVTAAASTFNDLTLLVLSNTSGTATRVDFRDTTAGSVLFSVYVPANDTRGFAAPRPIPQTTVNTNWTAQSSASITDLRIYAVFDKNK